MYYVFIILIKKNKKIKNDLLINRTIQTLAVTKQTLKKAAVCMFEY